MRRGELTEVESDSTGANDRLRSPGEILRLLRPNQWPKNLLVFVPLILAHQVTDPPKLLSGMLAFAAMNLASSAAYAVNDLLDVRFDLLHPKKRTRPFVAGSLSGASVVTSALLCLTASVALSLFTLPTTFLEFVLLYVVLAFAYSAILKKLIVLDVMVLSLLYGLRLLAGGAATGIAVSPWLLAFSTFLFLSLAFLKRFSELRLSLNSGSDRLPGRGYRLSDLGLIQIAGVSSALMSVVVFFIYIAGSEVVKAYYTRPDFLWMIGPLLIFWITRIWFLAERGEIEDDPLDFALRDLTSWFIGIMAVFLVLLAATG